MEPTVSRKRRDVDAKKERRLDVDDWVTAALAELADNGIDSVSVQSLARKLNVTKGSFYWHFRDRDALLEAMLQTWRRKATILVMERLEQRAANAKERLEGLLKHPFASPSSPFGAEVELAIRLWGRRDERARNVLTEIDHLRIRFIASIFADLGFTTESSRARAVLTYGFMRIGASLPKDAAAQSLSIEIKELLSSPAKNEQ